MCWGYVCIYLHMYTDTTHIAALMHAYATGIATLRFECSLHSPLTLCTYKYVFA